LEGTYSILLKKKLKVHIEYCF